MKACNFHINIRQNPSNESKGLFDQVLSESILRRCWFPFVLKQFPALLHDLLQKLYHPATRYTTRGRDGVSTTMHQRFSYFLYNRTFSSRIEDTSNSNVLEKIRAEIAWLGIHQIPIPDTYHQYTVTSQVPLGLYNCSRFGMQGFFKFLESFRHLTGCSNRVVRRYRYILAFENYTTDWMFCIRR
jgi:hypothetical protein